jgi:hypothetical protein
MQSEPAGAEVREGGLARWAPRITPPIGVDLTLQQELACASRILPYAHLEAGRS